MKYALLALLAAISACRPASAPDGSASYRAKDGSFRVSLPAGWMLDETSGETRRAVLFGPPAGPGRNTQTMGVYYHVAPDPQSAARGYLAAAQDGSAPIHEVAVGQQKGLEAQKISLVRDIHLGSQSTITRTVVLTVAGGFFSLEHTWPLGATPAPAFEDLVRTFRPAEGVKP